jgi:hypothetical protein
MASDSIKAVTESLPPASDYLTYLTILESHISPTLLPTLNDILQDAELTQNIGWDLIHLLTPLPGSEICLTTIARLGNPREVVLKVTEALQLLQLDSKEEEEKQEGEKTAGGKPTPVNRFCTLVNLLSILHPRIKTKYPSRFLSSSLMAILSAFRPSSQATLSVISFVHTISGKKRPPLPGRKSSLKIPTVPTGNQAGTSAPDPEAQEEDPHEAAIQTKLLQSFVTHVLEEYINCNSLEWAARLQESFDPSKVVTGRQSLGESYRVDPALQTRDTIVGQLVVSTAFFVEAFLTIVGSCTRSWPLELRNPLRCHLQDRTPPNGIRSGRELSLFTGRYTSFTSRLAVLDKLLRLLDNPLRIKIPTTEAVNIPRSCEAREAFHWA